MICAHGTSFENFISIITQASNYRYGDPKRGFPINARKNWTQSEPNKIYLWNETKDRDVIQCIKEAYWNACQCAAFEDTKKDKVVVMLFNIPATVLHKDETDDDPNNERVWVDSKLFIANIMAPGIYKSRSNVGPLSQMIKEPKTQIYGFAEFEYHPEKRHKYLYMRYLNGDFNDEFKPRHDNGLIQDFEDLKLDLISRTQCSEGYFIDEIGFDANLSKMFKEDLIESDSLAYTTIRKCDNEHREFIERVYPAINRMYGMVTCPECKCSTCKINNERSVVSVCSWYMDNVVIEGKSVSECTDYIPDPKCEVKHK